MPAAAGEEPSDGAVCDGDGDRLRELATVSLVPA
jgi:hypothetical protein